MKLFDRRLIWGAALVLGLTGGALAAANIASTGPSANPFVGLSDEEAASTSKTIVADSGRVRRERAIEFSQSGRSLDDLPRVEHQSDSPLQAGTLDEAAREADAIVVVTSEGGFVDERGIMELRLRVERVLKGVAGDTIEVSMYGGPRVNFSGDWVLAVAPGELYLERGERGVLFLTGEITDAPLLQRAHEAMKLEDGKVASAAWADSLGVPEDIVLVRLEQVVSEAVR